MTHKDLVSGQKYRVVKSGAHLSYWIPRQGYEEGGSVKLSEGDVIEYRDSAYGGGSDDVDYHRFSKDGQVGNFWPNTWGRCDLTYLELVDTN